MVVEAVDEAVDVALPPTVTDQPLLPLNQKLPLLPMPTNLRTPLIQTPPVEEAVEVAEDVEDVDVEVAEAVEVVVPDQPTTPPEELKLPPLNKLIDKDD